MEKEKENETQLYNDLGRQNLIDQTEAAKKKKDEIIVPTSTLTQNYMVDDSKLEELMEKYKTELSTLSNIGGKPDVISIDKLNKKLFDDITRVGTLLPIAKINKAPDGTHISNLENGGDITYSRIGRESGNNLTMAETKDGKIYFDEGTKNKFTGVVFVDRSDAKTGNLLDSKDTIRYKDGQVVYFIEGIGGNSRLGQLEQFMESASKFRNMERAQEIKEELAENVARRNPPNQERGTGMQDQHDQGVGSDRVDAPRRTSPPLPPRPDQNRATQDQGAMPQQQNLDVQWPKNFQQELASKAAAMTSRYQDKTPEQIDQEIKPRQNQTPASTLNQQAPDRSTTSPSITQSVDQRGAAQAQKDPSAELAAQTSKITGPYKGMASSEQVEQHVQQKVVDHKKSDNKTVEERIEELRNKSKTTPKSLGENPELASVKDKISYFESKDAAKLDKDLSTKVTTKSKDSIDEVLKNQFKNTNQEIKPNINAPNQFQQELASKAAAMTSRYQDKTPEQIDQEIKPRQNQTPASTLNQQAPDRSTTSPSITQSVDQRGAAQAQKDPSAELAAQTSKITAPYKGMASSEQVEQHVQQKVVDHKKSDNKTVEERIEELRNKSKTTPKSLGENPELASVKDKISYFESKDTAKLDKDLSTKVTTKSKDSIDEVLKNQFKNTNQEIKPNINAPNQFQQELASKAAAMTSRYQDKTPEQIDQEIKPRQNQTPASTLNQQAPDRSTTSPSITQSVDQRGAAQAQKDPSAELAAQTSKITAPYKGMASSEQVEQHVQQKVVDHKKSDNKTVEERIEELRNKSKTTPKSLGENPELASVKDKISYFESKDAAKLDKDLSTKVTTKSKDSIDEVLKNQFKNTNQEIKPNINAPNQFQQELASKAAAMTSRYQDKTPEQIDQEIKPRQNQTPASTLNQQAPDRSTTSPSITQSVDQRGAAQAQKDPSAELAAQTSKITGPYKGMASSEQVEQHVQQKVVDHKKSDNKTVEERIEELRNKSKTTPKSLGENPELASVKDKISYFESKDAAKLDKDLSTKVTTKSKDSIDEVLKNQFKNTNQEIKPNINAPNQFQQELASKAAAMTSRYQDKTPEQIDQEIKPRQNQTPASTLNQQAPDRSTTSPSITQSVDQRGAAQAQKDPSAELAAQTSKITAPYKGMASSEQVEQHVQQKVVDHKKSDNKTVEERIEELRNKSKTTPKSLGENPELASVKDKISYFESKDAAKLDKDLSTKVTTKSKDSIDEVLKNQFKNTNQEIKPNINAPNQFQQELASKAAAMTSRYQDKTPEQIDQEIKPRQNQTPASTLNQQAPDRSTTSPSITQSVDQRGAAQAQKDPSAELAAQTSKITAPYKGMASSEQVEQHVQQKVVDHKKSDNKTVEERIEELRNKSKTTPKSLGENPELASVKDKISYFESKDAAKLDKDLSTKVTTKSKDSIDEVLKNQFKNANQEASKGKDSHHQSQENSKGHAQDQKSLVKQRIEYYENLSKPITPNAKPPLGPGVGK